MAIDVDIVKARCYLEQLAADRQARLHTRFLQASRDFQRILDMLISQYPVTRVYQWGSLLNEFNFTEISDIDIAVEGPISAEEFFQLYGDAMQLTDLHLDLVHIDKIDPLHAESIRQKGRLVYDCSKTN